MKRSVLLIALGMAITPCLFTKETKANEIAEEKVVSKVVQSGWFEENGKIFYRLKNGSLATGGYSLSGDVYYFNHYGEMMRDYVRTVGNNTYYYGNDGKRCENKWIVLNGKSYYFKHDGRMAKGLLEINNSTYYFLQNGELLRNNWIKRNDKKYYFDHNGRMLTEEGFFTVNNHTYYITADGSAAIGGYRTNGYTYFFNSLGRLQYNYLRKVNNDTYYYDESGIRVQEQWINLNGKLYYFNKDGKMAQGLTDIDNSTYYFLSDGSYLKDNWIKRSNKRYYFDYHGEMVKDTFINLKGNTYLLTEDGTAAIGGYRKNGYVYFFNDLGIMQKSYLRDADSTKYYYDYEGRRVENRWITVKGKRYYFTENGKMAKGLTSIDEDKYYFLSDGSILTSNWVKQKDLRYYFLDDGRMLMNSGLTVIGNDTYFIKNNGEAAIGGYKTNGATYFFNEFGRMQKNYLRKTDTATYYYGSDGKRYENKWMTLNNQRVYFRSTGAMAKGKVKINTATYYFNNLGYVQKNVWITQDDKRYYFQGNGQMAVNAIRMNGTIYTFDQDGVFQNISTSGWVMENGKKKLYNSEGKLVAGASKFVIDISEHNGKIDWAKVKASGVDYVILRCGYGYTDDNSQMDKKFLENALELERLNIPYGVYLFSYGSNVHDAYEEAKYTLNIIKGRKISLPVYYDLEYSNYVGELSKSTYVDMAIAYCETIKKAGYTAGIYANTTYWENKLNDSRLDRYNKWVAEYAYADKYYIDQLSYKGSYHMWQYTSSGTVPGISGRVDLNAWY